MRNSEAVEILRKFYECRKIHCNFACGECDKRVYFDETNDAIKTAIEALEFCIEVDNDVK